LHYIDRLQKIILQRIMCTNKSQFTLRSGRCIINKVNGANFSNIFRKE